MSTDLGSSQRRRFAAVKVESSIHGLVLSKYTILSE